MRDLYKRLGVPSYASEADIRAAIERARDIELAESATSILLSPSNRIGYDNCHHTLLMIGQLRTALGLSNSVQWKQACADFASLDASFARTLQDDYLSLAAPRTSQTAPIANLLSSRLGCAALILAAVVISNFTNCGSRNHSTASPPRLPVQPSVTRPVFSEPALPMPRTGMLDSTFSTAAIAPLEVRTRAGGGSMLVRLVDNRTHLVACQLFVRAGEVASVEVPLGDYELRYAAGERWYGMRYLFGPDTVYSKADEIFLFSQSVGEVRGYTVELFLQPNGNLSTSRISASEF